MKKIYMILAAITLLSMSLNAQTTYEKVTSTDQLVVGNKYIFVSEEANTAMTATASNSRLTGESVTITSNTVTLSSNSNVAVFTLGGSSNSWTLVNGGKYLSGANNSTNLTLATSQGTYSTWRLNNNNGALSGYRAVNSSLTSRAILYRTSANQFGDYATSNIGSNSDYSYAFLYVEASTAPTIQVSTNSLSMSAAPGSSATETVTVTGLNLTGGINASISGTDATVFGVSPASLGTTGGTLTITYSPTAVGTHTATLTLTEANRAGADPVTITLNGTCSTDVTVCDGTNTNGYLPIYAYYYDNYQKNQMIYPENLLSGLAGKTITSMTFYANGNFNWSGGEVTARLATTDQTSYSSKVRLQPSDMAIVASGFDVPSSGNTWTITFTTPFVYNSGNLVIDMEETSCTSGSGHYSSSSFAFYGVTRTGGGFYSNAGTRLEDFSSVYSGGSVQNFLPKVTFTVEDTQPTIQASPSSVSMSAAPGESANQTVTVTGLNLTNGITATISGADASLFSVSPASLGTSGGTLTITYSPTAVGTHTATLTLSSTGATDVTITLNGTCSTEVTVSDGTDTDMYLPVYGSYYDEVQMNQMIYPASMLSNLQGKDITSITFYPASGTLANGTAVSGIEFYGGKVTLSLGSTTNNSFTSNAAISATVTEVASITNVQQDETLTAWTFTFDTPYRYEGGNLLLQVNTEAESEGYKRTFFYGTTMSNMGRHQCSGSGGNELHNFLPKATFTFEESTPPTPELTAPTNGSTVNVGTNEGSGVSTTINVSGSNLTENLTVSVSGTGFSVSPSSISAADANAGTTVTVTYTGTDPNATGTLTISSGEVSVTVDLTASYVQVVPTIAMTPASQTINDAAAGALTVTGTNVTGNINVSAGSDWSLSPTSLSSTGGQVNVSYTGRALSATTTVTASANGATDATATVNYVADLYIVTDNGVTGNWDFTNGTHMTYNANDGSYTATFTANNDNTFILFARMLGNEVDWNTRYVFGPDSNGDWWLNGDSGSGTIDTNDDDPIKIVNGGTYTVTIYSDGTFTITASSAPVQVPVLITPVNGSTVFVGTTSDEEPSVSKEIPISGNYLTKNLTATVSGEGFSLLTRDVTVPYADVNAATASVTVVYSGTDENATGTLTLSSDEVSATVNLTASYRKPVVLTEEPAGYVVQDRKTPNEISTAVIETAVDLFHGEVLSVTYVNTLGMTSDKPFEGVNIVVTRYSDGTTITSKEMR